MVNLYNFVAFEDDGNTGDGDTGDGGGGDDGDKTKDKKFSQDELNTILATEKRKTQNVRQELLSQLEEAKKTAKLGTESRTELEKKIEELQKVTMSAEERARQKETKLQRQYDEKLSTANEEGESWKARHTDLLISNALLRAASVNKAVEPTQLLRMLKNDVKIVQRVNEEGQLINGLFFHL